MAFYFCYSSALDVNSLNEWKLQHGYPDFTLPAGRLAFAVDFETVADFPSRFWGGRVLGLNPRAGARTAGILFEIEGDANWHVLRHKEGVVTGACVELDVEVQAEAGGPLVRAKAFTTHPSRRSTEGPLSAPFFSALKQAYAEWKLPTAPLDSLA